VKFFMKNNKNVIKWFTFVELIVSMIIASILLWAIFYFISANVEDIFLSNQKTEFYSSVNDFRNKVFDKISVYNSWTLIANNAVWSGSDILLLRSSLKTDGYLLWVVKWTSLETTPWAYSSYDDKSPWLVRIWSWTITSILANSWSLNGVVFNDSDVFSKLKIKDFHVNFYNTWNIIDMDLNLIQNYNSSFDWVNWSDTTLKWTSILKINLDF
jgi:hypothetical protein